ncbi:hypothetical protein K2X30_12470 [bacterium]|jgi:hypothetical protein|nr:hypothetical protein [bacterium]
MEHTPIQPFLLQLINFGKGAVIPMMIGTFVFTVIGRILIHYTVAREETFAKEFEKKVQRYLDQAPDDPGRSFYIITKKLLSKTFYEMFEKRAIMKRRKLDYVLAPSDRLFLIQQGSARMVRDTLREVRYLKYDGNPPPLLEIVKDVLSSNPCFTRVIGVFPIGPLNDLLNLIPGLFIVGGIFGTFLGIMQALPELGAMDIRDPESTKLVMDTFLARTAFSMGSSTVGILLSVISTVFNNFVSPEKLFVRSVDRYERSLFRIWIRCHNNKLPEQIEGFDEHRDAIDALEELSVDNELRGLVEYNTAGSSQEQGIPGAPPAMKQQKRAS